MIYIICCFFLRSVSLFTILLYFINPSLSHSESQKKTTKTIISKVLIHEDVYLSKLNKEILKEISGFNLKEIDNEEKDVFNYLQNGFWENINNPVLNNEIVCLAEAIYFEARGEEIKGQIAVAEVILNRVNSSDFPDKICKVVSEGKKNLNACQFSYNCDGMLETIVEKKIYNRILKISSVLYKGFASVLTDGAVFYHSDEVKPSWAKKLKKTAEIGRHHFYK